MEQLRARHILVETEESATALLERLKAGEDFAALARGHSLCPSRDQGGDLGFFNRGMMVREFEEACFALQPSELAGPVKTAFGYHLIQLTERRPA